MKELANLIKDTVKTTRKLTQLYISSTTAPTTRVHQICNNKRFYSSNSPNPAVAVKLNNAHTCQKCSSPIDEPINTINNSNNNNINNNTIIKPTLAPPAPTLQPNTQLVHATPTPNQLTKPVTSFYKRNLPSHLVEFSSQEGKQLFKEALENGHMEGYFSLAEQFVSQSDPAYCGLATLAMVLNALKIDPNRLWKGPWRWFADDMLDCCIPIESVKKRGITFTEFSCLSRCNGATIQSYRADESDIDTFRSSIIEASSKQGIHLVMSYSRKVLGQTGGGHYSPIGGYHKEKDLALVLDVARFKYSPHWVPVSVLWEAMQSADQETKRPRGYYVMSRNMTYQPSFCRVKNTLSWSSVADKFVKNFPTLLEQKNPATYQDVIETIFSNLPPETPYVLCAYSHELYKNLTNNDDQLLNIGGKHNHLCSTENCIDISNDNYSSYSNNHQHHNHHKSITNRWDQFFEEITRHSKSFSIITEMIKDSRIQWKVHHQHDLHVSKEICHDYPAQLATFLFLAFPAQLYNRLSIDIRDKLAELRNLDGLSANVISEIMKVREEMFLVNQSPCSCSPDQQQGCNK
ncbi:hypothetical protein CYY_005036 [Polysphondylium violaceum]|uniref:glutathione gamma-glutamylcysteinyltransferase n=1 Tax=Polysphondylium violaceum TaxID=133409 RepID=A0A8J4USI2_9MYCE|nr:hypothetical protein CYY_005036 [Polysphondylium violaceum]